MFIYKTTNLVNGKIYIGQHKANNDKYLGSGTIFKYALAKYGKENFQREILEYCETVDYLNDRERYWIKKLDSTNPAIGYNIKCGGEDLQEKPSDLQIKNTKFFRSALRYFEGYPKNPYKRIFMVKDKEYKKAIASEIFDLLSNGYEFSKRTTRRSIRDAFGCRDRTRESNERWIRQKRELEYQEEKQRIWQEEERARCKVLDTDRKWYFSEKYGYDRIFPWQFDFYESRGWKWAGNGVNFGNQPQQTKPDKIFLNYCYYQYFKKNPEECYRISLKNRDERYFEGYNNEP